MAKGQKRQKALDTKRQARAAKFKKEGGKGKSKYFRKKQHLHSTGLWGFEVIDKPW